MTLTTTDLMRPTRLDECIGLENVRAVLKLSTMAAQERGEPMCHTLFFGPPGIGKTTLSQALANEMGSRLVTTSGPTLRRPIDVECAVCMLRPGDVLFIDEALALNTPMNTPSGWRTIGDLKPGDSVFGSFGHSVTVTHVTETANNRPCYQVNFADGTSIVADAGHKWLASPRTGSRYLDYRIATTAQLAGDEPSHLYRTKRRCWRVPALPIIDEIGATHSRPIDPYVLGQWLGNGNTGQSYVNVRPSLIDSTIAEFSTLGEEPVNLGPTGDLMRVSLAGADAEHGPIKNGFRVRLENLGIFHAKAVPPIYLHGTVKQRLALVQGLMDTDGHVSRDGTATFSNTNEQIIDSMREVLRTLGYASTKAQTNDTRIGIKGAHRSCWKVIFRPNLILNPFRLRDTEKIRGGSFDRIDGRIVSVVPVPSVPVRCIAVDSPDHLFLAGEGMAPTHNCHRIPRQCEEILYPVLEDGTLHTIVGEGERRRTLVQPMPPCTIIGATTRFGMITAPLRERFGLVLRLEYYSIVELAKIVSRSAGLLGLHLDAEAQEALAKRSRGTPRIANQLLQRVRDWAQVINKTIDVTKSMVEHAMALVGIDERGLTDTDRRLLETVAVRYKGGPVGLDTLAAAIDEDAGTVTDVNEPYLMSIGFLTRTPKGRTITLEGRDYLEGK